MKKKTSKISINDVVDHLVVDVIEERCSLQEAKKHVFHSAMSAKKEMVQGFFESYLHRHNEFFKAFLHGLEDIIEGKGIHYFTKEAFPGIGAVEWQIYLEIEAVENQKNAVAKEIQVEHGRRFFKRLGQRLGLHLMDNKGMKEPQDFAIVRDLLTTMLAGYAGNS